MIDDEIDFHPCKNEKCTLSICWNCLQTWQEQCQKTQFKVFCCPQCSNAYDLVCIWY